MDERLLDLISEIIDQVENEVLEEMGLPLNSLYFGFSLKKGAECGIVRVNPKIKTTEEDRVRFRELMLERLW